MVLRGGVWERVIECVLVCVRDTGGVWLAVRVSEGECVSERECVGVCVAVRVCVLLRGGV